MKSILRSLINLVAVMNICDARCPEGQFMSSSGWSCYSPLVQGPCEQGEWLVLRNYPLLSCEERKCEEDEVEIGGECVNIYKSGLCSFGERMYANERGEGLCHCEQGWAKKESKCYQEFTRGPCRGSEMVRVVDDTKGMDKFSCTATTKKSRKSTTCKFPFFHNGQWTFGCVKGDPKGSKRSKGESWCPTQLDMKRRFIKGSNLWAVCDEKCPKDTEGSFLLSSNFMSLKKMMKASMKNMRKCQLTCIHNPCKNPYRNLPHSSTWDPMYPDPVCHPILEDLRNCVVSKERKGVGLVCSKTTCAFLSCTSEL